MRNASLGFLIGCAFCLATHLFMECQQAKLGHPRITLEAQS